MDENSANAFAFLGTPDGLKAYSEWLNDPITKKMKAAAIAASRPIGLATPKSEDALYYHGVSVGFATLASCIFEADRLLKNRESASELPEADFGMMEILKGFGYYGGE